MNYITILDRSSDECPNIGTITGNSLEQKFKKAIESHFDAEMISYSFVDKQIENFTDCIHAYPIDVRIKIDSMGEEYETVVELSQTWIY